MAFNRDSVVALYLAGKAQVAIVKSPPMYKCE